MSLWLFDKDTDWHIADQNNVREENQTRKMVGRRRAESGVNEQTPRE